MGEYTNAGKPVPAVERRMFWLMPHLTKKRPVAVKFSTCIYTHFLSCQSLLCMAMASLSHSHMGWWVPRCKNEPGSDIKAGSSDLGNRHIHYKKKRKVHHLVFFTLYRCLWVAAGAAACSVGYMHLYMLFSKCPCTSLVCYSVKSITIATAPSHGTHSYCLWDQEQVLSSVFLMPISQNAFGFF